MTRYASNFRIARGTGFQTQARPGHAIAGADIANSAAGGGPSNSQQSNTLAEKATETVTGTETGTGTDRTRDRNCGTGRDSLSDSDKGRLRDRERWREGGSQPCQLKPPASTVATRRWTCGGPALLGRADRLGRSTVTRSSLTSSHSLLTSNCPLRKVGETLAKLAKRKIYLRTLAKFCKSCETNVILRTKY